MPRLLAAYPISNEDLAGLPVRTLDAAVAYYERVLGFSVTSRTEKAAALERDGVRVGLISHRGFSA